MKKLLLLIACIGLASLSYAQYYPTACDSLDINQAKATFEANGEFFYNDITYANGFTIPKDSTTSTIADGGMWLGAIDPSGNLFTDAVYTSGGDFFPGPIMDSTKYSATTDSIWNRVWKINLSAIDSFVNWHANPSIYPGYTIPQVILDWPGNGDTTLGEAAQLAPFVDVNNDGIYDPVNSGDYPCIKGDQAIFFIFNDARAPHTQTGGSPFKIEVHGMAYEYHYPNSPLDSTVFIHLSCINYSGDEYDSMRVGNFTFLTDGASNDNFIGCDVGRATYYIYNGTTNDGGNPIPQTGTYGANPPAEGVVLLEGPFADPGDGVDNNHNGQIDEPGERITMTNFMYFHNDFTVTGNPINVVDYYNYLRCIWKDNTSLKYGGNGHLSGGVSCKYMYPGNTDPTGWGTSNIPQPAWSEVSAGDTAGIRNGIGSSGYFTFKPGGSFSVDYAYVYGRAASGGNLASVTVMQHDIDSVRSFYEHHVSYSCQQVTADVNEIKHNDHPISLYPNPAKDEMLLSYKPASKNASYVILNDLGQTVEGGIILRTSRTWIHVSNLAHGLYLLRVDDGEITKTVKFVH